MTKQTGFKSMECIENRSMKVSTKLKRESRANQSSREMLILWKLTERKWIDSLTKQGQELKNSPQNHRKFQFQI